MFRRVDQFAMMLVVGVMATACGSSSTSPVAPTPQAATLAAVVVTSAPASGTSFQLTATARMSDGTSRDVTSAATWESSNPVIATVSPAGMVLFNGRGELDVRATYQSLTGSTHLAVAAPPVVAPPNSSLSGVIAEAAPNARPIAGARVQLLVGYHTFSDDQGAFVLEAIPEGRTIIEVSRDGYQTWSNEIVIDRATQLNVILYPAPK